tara:strand:+ start:280 stop:555 length:276 start_codon:yes stop_codon:yes gene_type:complete
MSYQIQDSITEYIDEQVEYKISDAISDNHEVQEVKHNLETLEARLDDDIVNEVIKQVIHKLLTTVDGDYVMVKRSHLEDLKTQATQSKDVA